MGGQRAPRAVTFDADARQAHQQLHPVPVPCKGFQQLGTAVVVQLLSGRMEFTVAGETSTLITGDVVYLAPGVRHALTAIEPCHMSLTMVDVDAASTAQEGVR